MPMHTRVAFVFVCSSCVCDTFQEADDSLLFDEQILEAAKSIAGAVSALVKAASADLNADAPRLHRQEARVLAVVPVA